MLSKLRETELYFLSVSDKLSQPDITNDRAEFLRLMSEHRRLSPIIEKYQEYKALCNRLEQAKEILVTENDKDLRLMANEEIKEIESLSESLISELKLLLLPKDPNDFKNVIVEIRAGAGGEEAALFVATLFRMYSMYVSRIGYKIETLGSNETELGGYREISFMIEGEGAFSKFKYESGVHRVQRVPETESQGRIHTSTVTVAVLPEAEEVEVEINQRDLKIDTIKSTGAGGQHINKTESAIRILHIPTGIVVECQDERSQFKNRDKAMKILRAKLFDIKRSEQEQSISESRRSQVGTGDRSEKIRTYNFPQSRVTDHRIGYTLYSLDSFINGNIDSMLDALASADAAEKLRASEGK